MTLLLVPLHGIGGRQDLPLPFGVVVVAAAVALIASFVVLTLTWRTPRFNRPDGYVVVNWLSTVTGSQIVRSLIRTLGACTFGWALMALLLGPNDLSNPVFGFVYVWVWVGLVPLSLLFGRVWILLSPMRTIYLVGCRLLRHDPEEGLFRLPQAVGVWPATVALFIFVWLELVMPDPATRPVVLLAVAMYGVALLFGAVVFGRSWFGAADPFEAYATVVAHLSPWGRDAFGALVLRSPLANLSTLRPRAGTVGFVTVLLGSTAFDGLSRSTGWISWIQDAAIDGELLATAGLLAVVAVVVMSFTAASRLTATVSGIHAAGHPGQFAHSLVPIALGYVTAHYMTLFWFEGQRTLISWSDPLGRGWNVFGTAAWTFNYDLAAYPSVIAVAQAGAVVVGHLLGIVAAHDRTLELVPGTAAIRAQLPMLIVMVGYTVSGLLLLFAP